MVRARLRVHGLHQGWSRLREILGVQQRVTATFRQRDGRTLHVRKATVPDPELREIYTMLNLPSNPGGIKKQTYITHDDTFVVPLADFVCRNFQ